MVLALKRITFCGMGRMYLGAFGGSVHVSVSPTCLTVVAKRGSRLSLFRSMRRKKPLKAKLSAAFFEYEIQHAVLIHQRNVTIILNTMGTQFIYQCQSMWHITHTGFAFGSDEKQLGRANGRVGPHIRNPYWARKWLPAKRFGHKKVPFACRHLRTGSANYPTETPANSTQRYKVRI